MIAAAAAGLADGGRGSCRRSSICRVGAIDNELHFRLIAAIPPCIADVSDTEATVDSVARGGKSFRVRGWPRACCAEWRRKATTVSQGHWEDGSQSR
jgi:hypothetical protein